MCVCVCVCVRARAGGGYMYTYTHVHRTCVCDTRTLIYISIYMLEGIKFAQRVFVCVCIRVCMHACGAFLKIHRYAAESEATRHTKLMSVTAAVFQLAIGPYVAAAVVESAVHADTAILKFELVMAVMAVEMAVCAATWAGSTRSSARPARWCDRILKAHLHRRYDVLMQPIAAYDIFIRPLATYTY